jgi:hypothetical protein
LEYSVVNMPFDHHETTPGPTTKSGNLTVDMELGHPLGYIDTKLDVGETQLGDRGTKRAISGRELDETQKGEFPRALGNGPRMRVPSF